jgi:hypothetical protein
MHKPRNSLGSDGWGGIGRCKRSQSSIHELAEVPVRFNSISVPQRAIFPGNVLAPEFGWSFELAIGCSLCNFGVFCMSSATTKREAPSNDGYTALHGAGFLVAAVVMVVAVYVARPAPVSVFSRVMAWESLGSLVPVDVRDGSKAVVQSSMFVIDDKRDISGLQVPLLFVHGFPTSSFDFKDVWPSLCHTNKRRCIALDLLGYGLSDKPSCNYTIAMHA